MSNSILHKRRTLNSADPLYTDLSLGELAINTMTARLFMKDNNDAVIDVGTNVIGVEANYNENNGELTPTKINLNGSFVPDLVLHKGLGYTFRITETKTSGFTGYISGTDIMFYVQATSGGTHQEYTTTVTHQDHSATIYIPLDAPDNLKYGIRDSVDQTSAIEDSGGSVIYSDSSGGGGGSATSSEQLISSDAVFSWDTNVDVWKTGADEGLKATSGKLVLGSTTLTTSNNIITFDSLTTLDNVHIDCGQFNND